MLDAENLANPVAQDDLAVDVARTRGEHPLPQPQTGALVAPAAPDVQDSEISGGKDALGGTNPMAQAIARHQIAAGQVHPGGAKEWAENVVSGVNAALAGFGAGGKVPPGAGALYGVGAAARQAQEARAKNKQQQFENKAKTQELGMEERRVKNEEETGQTDRDVKLAENARQQAQNIREASEHDARMQQLGDEHKLSNFELMKADVDWREDQVEKEDNIKKAGGKLLKIGGQDAPAFEDLGKAEDFAKQNDLGKNAHNNGFRSRVLYGADHQYHIYEVPDDPPSWHTIEGADGKKQRVLTDSTGLINYQDKMAEIRRTNAEAAKDYAGAKKDLQDFKDAGTVKAARVALDKVGGDYTKLGPGEKEALTTDAQKRLQLTSNVYQVAQRDMEHDEDYGNLPTLTKGPNVGSVDTGSDQYKDLAKKYHVDEAAEQMWDSFDTLRQLGHGYNKPGGGGGDGRPHTVDNPTSLPKPPQPGAKLTKDDAALFLKQAGGDKLKAAQLATQAGWDIKTQ
jgi:hypothetical protein